MKNKYGRSADRVPAVSINRGVCSKSFIDMLYWMPAELLGY
jgi:hypothetical protein